MQEMQEMQDLSITKNDFLPLQKIPEDKNELSKTELKEIIESREKQIVDKFNLILKELSNVCANDFLLKQKCKNLKCLLSCNKCENFYLKLKTKEKISFIIKVVRKKIMNSVNPVIKRSVKNIISFN